VKSYDDQFYLIRFTPRRSRSKWSLVNVERRSGASDGSPMRLQADARGQAGCGQLDKALTASARTCESMSRGEIDQL
jgi:hypothetical protein